MTMYVHPYQEEALHVLHARTGAPMAAFVREGLDLLLAKYDVPKEPTVIAEPEPVEPAATRDIEEIPF